MTNRETTTYKITKESAFTLSLSVLKFYYETAQNRMSDYHKQAGDTTERAYKVIAIYVSLLTLLCAYLFSHGQPAWGLLPVWLLLVGCACATFYMVQVIMPRDYMPLGRRVRDLQPNEYALSFSAEEEPTPDETQMRCILCDEINMLEESIRWQEERNAQRTRFFGISLKFMLAGIGCSIISYFILMLIL